MPGENKVQLEASLSVEKLVSDLQQAKQDMTALKGEVETSNKKIKEGFDQSASSVRNLSSELQQTLGRIEAQKTVIQKLNAELDSLRKNNTAGFDDTKLKSYQEQIKKLEVELAALKTQGSAAVTSITTVGTESTKTGGLLSNLLSQVKNLAGGFGLLTVAGPIINFITTSVKEMWEEFTNARGKIIDAAKEFNSFADAADGVRARVDELTKSLAYIDKLGKINLDIDFGKGLKADLLDLNAQFVESQNTMLGLANEEKRALENVSKAREHFFEKASQDDKDLLSEFNGNEKAAAELMSENGKKLVAIILDQTNALTTVRAAQSDTEKKQNIIHAQIQLTHKEIDEKALKDAEDAAKKRKAQADKELAELEARAKRIADLERQLAQLRVDAMDEGRQKDIAQENARFNAAINSLQVLRENSKTSARERELIDQIEQQQRINHRKKLLEIDQKYYRDVIKAFESAQKEVDDLLLTDREKEIKSITDKYAKAIADIGIARKKLLEIGNPDTLGKSGISNASIINAAADLQISQLTEAQRKAQDEVNKKYDLKRLDEAEKLSLALNDIFKVQGVDQERLTEIREINSLNIIIEYAKRKIEVLKAAGADQNKLQIAQLEKVIEDAQLKLEGIKKNKDIDLFSFLGIDKDSAKRIKEVVDGVSKLGEVVASTLQPFIDAYDQKIKAIDDLISKLDEQISAQESAVEHEKQLAEQGYANNLAIEEQRLKDLQKQRDEELEQEKKLQEEKKKLQKAQIFADGIAQGSNLITAATDIFKVLAKLGPIGVVLAIATIGTMLSGFIAAKAAALKAVDQGSPKFAEGGGLLLDGASHAEGGIKLIDSKTGKVKGEAQRNEYGYFFKDGKRVKEKYEPLLNAINKDELSNWKITPSGISFDYEQSPHLATGGDHRPSSPTKPSRSDILLERIAVSNEKLLQREEDRESVEEKADKTIIRKGKHTRIIHKGNAGPI